MLNFEGELPNGTAGKARSEENNQNRSAIIKVSFLWFWAYTKLWLLVLLPRWRQKQGETKNGRQKRAIFSVPLMLNPYTLFLLNKYKVEMIQRQSQVASTLTKYFEMISTLVCKTNALCSFMHGKDIFAFLTIVLCQAFNIWFNNVCHLNNENGDENPFSMNYRYFETNWQAYKHWFRVRAIASSYSFFIFSFLQLCHFDFVIIWRRNFPLKMKWMCKW